MASFRFIPFMQPNGNPAFRVEMDPMGKGLPRFPHSSSAEQMTPTLGEPNVFPTGTDFRTPGMIRKLPER